MNFWTVKAAQNPVLNIYRVNFLIKKTYVYDKQERTQEKKKNQTYSCWFDCPGDIGNWVFLRYKCTLLLNTSMSEVIENTDKGIKFLILNLLGIKKLRSFSWLVRLKSNTTANEYALWCFNESISIFS